MQNLMWRKDSNTVTNISSSEFELFEFENCIMTKDSSLNCNNCRINNIVFNSIIGSINFKNLEPLKSYVRFKETKKGNDFYRKGGKDFKFYEEKSPSMIQLIDSDLARSSFISCELSDFEKLIYFNTKILEIFVAGSTFPETIEIPEIINENDIYIQKRLFYSQLKKVFENRGDNVGSTEYLAVELETYRLQLKAQRKSPSTRFNLFLNKFSSNYGNDWVRAVFVTLILNFLLFSIYCQLLGYGIGLDYKKGFELFSYSFEYLNPLRKADFIDTKELKPFYSGFEPIARIWDYFSRIVIAFFSYQTIQSFRRFGRNK